ncbi:hypothetical protein Leryth_011697 [Lithospermum erythrorhizon]|nr:hypothetical protein Leryth_011697 [Lithospermum erythrorhizon]
MEGSKVYLAIIIVRAIYAGMFVISKAAFNDGMNSFVFVFYRQAAASIFLAPIAIFFEWKTAPPFSFLIFVKIFMLSLVGITMSLNIYGVALKYTSATLAAATTNSLPIITLFLALLFRMERLNFKTKDGILKLAGVAITMGGIVTIAFYKGRPYLKLLLNHPLVRFHGQEIKDHVSYNSTWTKGVFLMLLSNITWGCWLVLQGRVLMSYPSKLLLTTWLCFFSAFQSFIVAISIERNMHEWELGWNVRLLSVAYCGIAVTGISFYLQAWIVEKKGPVFFTATIPLSFIITMVFSLVFLGEVVSLGSVLGAILLVGGLSCVLWAKSKELKRKKLSNCASNKDVLQDGPPKSDQIENMP